MRRCWVWGSNEGIWGRGRGSVGGIWEEGDEEGYLGGAWEEGE